MNHSESMKEIAPALVKAQATIKAAVKDSSNPFFKSKYADLATIIEAVRTPLNAAGICFLQPASEAEHGVRVETILLHVSGEWVSESVVVPVSKDDAQGMGSALTYGRRYGLQSMCGVPVEDDDGNAATKSPPAKKGYSGSDGAMGGQSAEDQTKLRNIANRIVDLWLAEDYYGAYEQVYVAKPTLLSNDEIIAVYEALREHSKIRSAIKKMRRDVNRGLDIKEELAKEKLARDEESELATQA